MWIKRCVYPTPQIKSFSYSLCFNKENSEMKDLLLVSVILLCVRKCIVECMSAVLLCSIMGSACVNHVIEEIYLLLILDNFKPQLVNLYSLSNLFFVAKYRS